LPLDYEAAKALLDATFPQAEVDFAAVTPPNADATFREACDAVFHSDTQAYREVLLGCVLARIQDKTINIRQPYVNQGNRAFNGRTLDEQAVNPFLQSRRVPCSRGPYLSAFRRSVQFDEQTRKGVRDKAGYDQLLVAIGRVEAATSAPSLALLLRYMLYKFVELREAAHIGITTLQRVSLEQYDALLSGLLAAPSQGRFPVLLLVATFKAISTYFGQNWTLDFQGINAADAAAGVGGDITIRSGDQILLVAEVTERIVNRDRVVATFQAKIAPQRIEEYLFFIRPEGATADARQQAHQYFAQGHEVNFLEIKT
jgi:hypothetical protein